MAKNSVREASLIFGDSSLLSKRRRRGDGRETLRDRKNWKDILQESHNAVSAWEGLTITRPLLSLPPNPFTLPLFFGLLAFSTAILSNRNVRHISTLKCSSSYI